MLVYIFIVYTRVEVKDTQYGWAHARKGFRDYNNQNAKNKLYNLAVYFQNLALEMLALIYG